ncbi:MAG: hypothetical protein NTU62_16220 [Spirochaetes bacterium]|nr:hypothetical protein [Spirochaetota bacterium]
MRKTSILTILVISFLAAAALLAADPVRAGRIAGVAAAVQLAVWPGFDVVATLRAGGEWQSPWKVFAGVEAAALFQFPGVGWLGGVYVGARF